MTAAGIEPTVRYEFAMCWRATPDAHMLLDPRMPGMITTQACMLAINDGMHTRMWLPQQELRQGTHALCFNVALVESALILHMAVVHQ